MSMDDLGQLSYKLDNIRQQTAVCLQRTLQEDLSAEVKEELLQQYRTLVSDVTKAMALTEDLNTLVTEIVNKRTKINVLMNEIRCGFPEREVAP